MKNHRIESFYFRIIARETHQSWKIGATKIRKHDLRQVFKRDDFPAFVELLYQARSIRDLYELEELSGAKKALAIAARAFLVELQIGDDYSRACLLRETLEQYREKLI